MTLASRLKPAIASTLMLSGCISTATAVSDTRRLVSAEPIETQFTVAVRNPSNSSQTEQVILTPATSTGTGYEKLYLGYVIMDSGMKCQAFADRLSTAQRGVDTSFDILSVILSALATAFTPLSTVHALTAAATISTGTKAAIDADVYAKAAAALILQQINNTYYAEIKKYRDDLVNRDDRSIVPTLEVSSIQAIHRQCSLDAAVASLSQIGAASKASAAAAAGAAEGARANPSNPTAGAIAGAAVGAAAGTAESVAAAPTAAAQQGAAAAATALAPPVVSPPAAGTPSPAPGTAGGSPVPLIPSPGTSAPPPKGPVVLTPSPEKPIGSAKGPVEQRVLFSSEGRKIQRALCIDADAGAVIFGPATRRAIELLRTTTTDQNITASIPNIETQGLTPPEAEVLLGAGDCPRSCYANAFEYFEYGPKSGMRSNMSIPPGEREKKFKSLLDLLGWAASETPGQQQIKDFCDPATRALIRRALAAQNISADQGLSDAIRATLAEARRKEGSKTPSQPTAPPK